MQPINASKLKIPTPSLITWVRRSMCLLLSLIVIRASAQMDTAQRSGSIIKGAGEQTTYFFISGSSPSYLHKYANSKIEALIKNDGEFYKFKIERNFIQEAIVEKRFGNIRVVANFILKDEKYQLQKFTFSNRFGFAFDATCSQENAVIGPGSNLSDITKVVKRKDTAKEKKVEFLSQSCKNLNLADARKLQELYNYFKAKNDLSKRLVRCLSKKTLLQIITKNNKDFESTGTKDQDDPAQILSGAIDQIKKTFQGDIEQANGGVSPLSIECEKNVDAKNTNPAKFDADTGKIIFYLKDELDAKGRDALLDAQNLRHVFVHEFVHSSISQPHMCSADIEDKIAESIAVACAPMPKSKFVSASSNVTKAVVMSATALDVSLSDTAKISEAGAIEITAAVAGIPVQNVDPTTLSYVSNLPSSDQEPAAVEQVLPASFAPAMSHFTKAVGQIAEIVIPHAEAQIAKGSVRANGVSSSAIIEDSIVPNPSLNHQDVPSYSIEDKTYSPTPGNLAVASTILDEPRVIAVQPKSPAEVPRRDSLTERLKAGGDKNSNSGASTFGAKPPVAALGVSAFDLKLQRLALNEALAVPQSYPIGGVPFGNHSLVGDDYAKFLSRMKDPEFLKTLEQNGILISRKGVVLTQPKKVAVIYIDTGVALLYGNIQ